MCQLLQMDTKDLRRSRVSHNLCAAFLILFVYQSGKLSVSMNTFIKLSKLPANFTTNNNDITAAVAPDFFQVPSISSSHALIIAMHAVERPW